MRQRVLSWLADRVRGRQAAWAVGALIVATVAGTALEALVAFSRPINLLIAGALFVAFILWPLRFGYLGALISVPLLVSGSVFTIREWVLRADAYYLSIAVSQLSTAISAAIISVLVERDLAHNRTLERAATVDGLTGLFNRRQFVMRIEQELARGSRNGDKTALMYIDLDNFKPINDTFGHRTGDDYLRAFAKLLLKCVRANDTVYRLGGDEFAVILPSTGEDGARHVAERLRSEMAASDLGLPSSANPPSASIGMSVAPTYASNQTELTTQADSALYHAKHAGRDQIRLFQDVFSDILHYFSSGNEELIWSLKSLLWSAAARDHYTYGHSERVATYATALAAEYGLSPERVASIRISAILHDLGRVHIPEEILMKEGPLTEAEDAIIRRHPEHAAEILKPLAGMGSVVEDVLHHHECVDGTGYPDGLAGEQIPVGARIIAIADAFDSMCNDRPYRPAMPVERAIREIRNSSGTAYDPDIVAVAQELLPRLERGEDNRASRTQAG